MSIFFSTVWMISDSILLSDLDVVTVFPGQSSSCASYDYPTNHVKDNLTTNILNFQIQHSFLGK